MNKMFQLNKITCLFFLFYATTLHAAPLTGTKTIGGTAPDYPTFSAAVTDLNLNGAGAGGVTFNLRDGNYAGNVTITATGTLANPIVFQSENLDASTVTISSGGSADVIALEGASYITLRALTVDYTANLGYSAIEIGANSDFVTISGCVLDGSVVTGTTFSSSTVYASESMQANDCENLVVQNCTIRNGSYGIYFGMSTAQPAGVVIENNRFENGYAGGMYLQNLAAPTVHGNTITTTQTGNSSFYGVYLNNCDGKNLVTANYIFTSGSGEIGYGIFLTGSSSSSGNNALLANNSIQISNTASIAIGIDQSNNSMYYDILFNTIYVSGGTSSSTYAYRTFTSSDDTKIRNNIFANFASGTGLSSNQTVYIANATGISLASHNVYWTENTGNPFRANYNGSYTTLSAYTTALGEVSAMNVNPMMTFITDVGWKATNPALTGGGVYLADVPADIDGLTRLNPTTIGAHENAASTPLNDNICNATILNFDIATPYSNGGGTAEGNEPVPPTADCSTGWCAGDMAVQNSVWFTFTLPQTRKVTISTTGFDNQIALYTAASCSSALTFVAANDNSGSAAQIISQCLSAGTYYLQIDGFQGASGTGNVTVTPDVLMTPYAFPATPLCHEFIANWSGSPGATNYFIDVAINNSFTIFVPGFNNYDAGNATSLLISPLTQGNLYYYRVRASDGCVTTGNSTTEFIQPLELPEANFTYVVNGLTVTFTNTTGDGDTYLWSFGTGQTLTIENPSYVYSAPGIYQVQLIATNTCGNDTVTQTVEVNCSSIQVPVTPNANVEFCDGDSVELATTPVSGYAYQWLKNGQPIGGAENFTYTALESGTYRLRVMNPTNCVRLSNEVIVTEHPDPVVTISYIGSLALCAGNYVELMATSGGSTYQWLNDAQIISNANSSAYIAYNAGNYSLSVTDANNCSGISSTLAVTEVPNPVVSIQANGPTTFCAGDDVTLQTTTTGLTYQWMNNNQNVSGSGTSYAATTSGNYSLSVIDANNCTATSNSIPVVVNALPDVSFGADDTLCRTSNPTQLTLSGGTPAGGFFFVDDVSATHFDLTAPTGSYEVKYQYTDANNCTGADSVYWTLEICNSIGNIPAGDVLVTPNPASDFLNIKDSAALIDEQMKVQVFDVAGKEIIHQRLSNKETSQVDLKRLEAGIYLVRVSAADRVLREVKITVLR